MSAKRSVLSMTLDAVEAMLPRNCRERLEELERSAAAEPRPTPKGRARRQRELLDALARAARLAARLGPLWRAAGAGIAYARHAAGEAARGTALALPETPPRKRKAEPAGQLRLWPEPEEKPE